MGARSRLGLQARSLPKALMLMGFLVWTVITPLALNELLTWRDPRVRARGLTLFSPRDQICSKVAFCRCAGTERASLLPQGKKSQPLMPHPSPSLPAHRAFLLSGEGENRSLRSRLVLILRLLYMTIAWWQPCRMRLYHLCELPIVHPPGGQQRNGSPGAGGPAAGDAETAALCCKFPVFFFLLALTE